MQTGQRNLRPNVLFVLTDDQHFRALGAAGNPEIRTPNLDRLAAEGARFTHCYVSNPICTPSRACIQTGQYGFTNGVTFFGQPMRADAPRLATLMSDRGYQTCYVGKWHNEERPSSHGYAHMRHVFLGGMHDFSSIPVVQDTADPKAVIEGNPTDIFTDGALDLLARPVEEPFFLMLSYTAPHDPRTPPPAFEAMYPPDSVSLPRNFMPEPRFDPGTLDIRDEKLLPRPLDPDAVRTEIGRYYGMITHLDEQLGRVLAALDESGRLDNTVIIVAGDNGLALGAHGLLGKQTMYEEGVRVPLIARGPGVQRGAECRALVDLMDVMPTICDLGGVPIPEGVEARTLTPLLSGRRARHREAVFCHYHDMFRMVRTRDYKLIRHLKTGREEFYELRQDPYEMKDLAGSEAHRAALNAHRVLLARWRHSMNDPDPG